MVQGDNLCRLGKGKFLGVVSTGEYSKAVNTLGTSCLGVVVILCNFIFAVSHHDDVWYQQLLDPVPEQTILSR